MNWNNMLCILHNRLWKNQFELEVKGPHKKYIVIAQCYQQQHCSAVSFIHSRRPYTIILSFDHIAGTCEIACQREGIKNAHTFFYFFLSSEATRNNYLVIFHMKQGICNSPVSLTLTDDAKYFKRI